MFFMLIFLLNQKIAFDRKASRNKVMTHFMMCQCDENMFSSKSRNIFHSLLCSCLADPG